MRDFGGVGRGIWGKDVVWVLEGLVVIVPGEEHLAAGVASLVAFFQRMEVVGWIREVVLPFRGRGIGVPPGYCTGS